MTLRLDAHTLPRLQAAGMVGVVLFLILIIAGYFIFKFKSDSEARLLEMRSDIYKEQQAILQREVQSAHDYVLYMYNRAEKELIRQSREQVLKAHQIATAIYNEEQGLRTDAEIKHLITETLRSYRFFNGRGYIFVDDLDGNAVLLPTKPELEGRSLYDNQDDTGFYIMRGLINAAKTPEGEGVVRYRWYPPADKTHMADKIAFVKKFEPFDWLIGTGDYLFKIQQDLEEQALERVTATRFGENGYIAVVDTDQHTLYSAAKPASYVGLEFSEQDEEKLIEEFIAFANKGGGIYQYTWFYPGSTRSVSKLSLIRKIPQTDWILIAGIYPEKIEQTIAAQRTELEANTTQDMWTLVAMLTAAALLTLMVALIFADWFNRLFKRYQNSIDQQQQALEENAHELQIAARVFENATEGILVTDPEGVIVASNPALTAITGFDADELIGDRPSRLASGYHNQAFYQDLWDTLISRGVWQGEIWNRRKSGEVYPQWLAISTSRNTEGEVTNYVAAITDISERKDAEQKLRYLADYDSLTNLPNRRFLASRVAESILRCQRGEQSSFALLFIDLDRFKNINDSLGHAVGDSVLTQVATRLEENTREPDICCRLGGDEFVVLVNCDNAKQRSIEMGAVLLKELAEPMLIGCQRLVITPSIGVAVFPEDGEDFDTLLRNADTALYAAKDRGRNNIQFFVNELAAHASIRLQMENDLRHAINNHEFELYYQAQYRLNGHELTGSEALIRWHHPERGLVSPVEFIPLAEETGLIVEIGTWVLETACKQAVTWLQAGYPAVPVAVNVSSKQFRDDFVAVVSDVLDNTELAPELLTLEVTESILMENLDTAATTLHALKGLGVNLALDDFGTGYSSLAYLKQFPIDKLKIDRAFIIGLPEDHDDAAITRSIVDVAHNLKLETIAEGVETEAQQNSLIEFGCDQVQGYRFARPVSAASFINVLEREAEATAQ